MREKSNNNILAKFDRTYRKGEVFNNNYDEKNENNFLKDKTNNYFNDKNQRECVTTISIYYYYLLFLYSLKFLIAFFIMLYHRATNHSH